MILLAVDHFTFPHLFTSRAVHLSLSAVNYYFTRLNAVCKGLEHSIFIRSIFIFYVSLCS